MSFRIQIKKSSFFYFSPLKYPQIVLWIEIKNIYQTREHALLVRSLGISQLVIAVNKLDTVKWDKNRFDDIKMKLNAFLTKQAGFREKDLVYVPCR